MCESVNILYGSGSVTRPNREGAAFLVLGLFRRRDWVLATLGGHVAPAKHQDAGCLCAAGEHGPIGFQRVFESGY